MKQQPDGFTLVEVMIASVILFGSLVAITEGYRTSVEASRRAEATIRMVTPLPLIVSQIRESILSDPQEANRGAGQMLGVSFRYEAVLSKSAAALPPPDPEGAVSPNLPERYRLYDIRVSLEVRGVAVREFVYQELVWSPESA